MKSVRIIFISVALIIIFSLPAIARGKIADTKTDKKMSVTDLRLLLNTFTGFADEHIDGVAALKSCPLQKR
jgi:hypothetical protein